MTNDPSVDQAIATSTEQTVQFRADQPVQESEPLVTQVFDPLPFSDDLEHGLKDILARPLAIDTATWKSSDLRDHRIFAMMPITKLMDQENFRDKISKFAYGTFTQKLRFMCNFTPTQAGKLLVGAYPASANQTYLTTGVASTFQLSTMRHVEIDAGSQEEVELELPFFNDISCYELDKIKPPYSTPFPTWEVFCLVLNPLTGATNNEEVDINIFSWLEDVNLKMPTGQIAGKPEQQTEGEKKQEKGSVSSTLATASAVAGSLAAVPPLAEVAEPVSWAAGAASGIASFFGFSKPYNVGTNDRRTIQPANGMANIDGADTSIKLSAMTDANVEQSSEKDEMVIQEIAKRQGIVGRSSWSYADAKDSILYSAPVTPFTPNVYQLATGQRYMQCSPLSWLATMFMFWCGDLSYRFSFAKNEFYTGKLLISFHPGANTEVYGQDNQVYRRVVSIKNTNDFTFTIPYVYKKHWCQVDGHIGIIQVQVLNRLQATAVVADTIEFNVWMFSNNIEFAVPNPVLGVSAISADFTPGRHLNWQRLATDRRNAIAIGDGQILQTPNVAEPGHPDYLFGSPTKLNGDRRTIGEKIVNLRPLTRRFNRMGFGVEGSYTLNSAIFQSPPFGIDATYSDVTIQEYLSAAYRFMRGGVRIKMITPKTEGLGFMNQTELDSLVPSQGGGWTGKRRAGASGYTFPAVNGVAEAEIPFYSDREHWFTSFDQTAVYGPSFTVGYLTYDDSGNLGVDRSVNFPSYWAGADDFTHSMFMGVPIIMLPPHV